MIRKFGAVTFVIFWLLSIYFTYSYQNHFKPAVDILIKNTDGFAKIAVIVLTIAGMGCLLLLWGITIYFTIDFIKTIKKVK